MQYLDYSAEDPATNLAIDEWLLEEVEKGGSPPTLRVWESPVYFVVLGYSSPLREDVYRDACQRDGVPILRRVSGGGTVLQGPGCLNYALIDLHDGALDLAASTRRVFELLRRALAPLVLACKGTSDLVWNGRKCVGNAERRKKHSFLYHGSILYDFDIPRMRRYLKIPPKQPAYRDNRPHEDFVANLPISAPKLKQDLYRAFGCRSDAPQPPERQSLTPFLRRYCDPNFIDGH